MRSRPARRTNLERNFAVIMMMMAAALADISAATAIDQFELKRVQPQADTRWTLPDLDYGDGQSCPPLVERELNERMTLSVGPDCGKPKSDRPDPIGPSAE